MAENLDSELQLAWQGQLDERVSAIVCAANGRGWAASSAAGSVIWNAGQGEIVVLLAAQGELATAEAIDSVFAGEESELTLQTCRSGQNTPTTIDRLAFSPDSRWLAAGGQAGMLFVWNYEDSDLPPQRFRQINCHKWIEHLVWHPTHPDLLAIGCGSEVKIWNIQTATELASCRFDRSIFDLAWHPDGTELAVAGAKGVRIWSPTAATASTAGIEIDTASLQVAWSADGRYLAAGNLDRTLTIVDRSHPDERWTLQGCPGKIRQIAWLRGSISPCLAVASGSEIVLWSLDTDTTTWEGRLLEGHQGIVEVLVTHPRLQMLASGGADGYVCLWSIEGEISQIITMEHLSGFTSVSWHFCNEYLVVGSQTGSICVWVVPA